VVQETVLNGRYRLGEVLGEGGMAVVYRAQDVLLNRPVAVKILRAQYAADESFLRRFEREAQSAAGFSHPNIVNVYDVGTDGNQHYIVMEYIRGPSLKELIRRQGPFSVDGAIFIIGQVTSALDYAHHRGLIHRDIKPQNILVDRDGNAKVVDFGIAKGMRDVNLTEAGTGMGTVHYVSPEQAQGEPAGPASDLYSTGVVLFEMLTKRLPFEADTPVGVAMQHVNSPPPPPSTFNPRIPPEVDAIVLRSLAKEPAERFPSGAALATALRHWDMLPPSHMPYDDPARPPARDTTALPPRVRTAPPPPPRNQPRPERRPASGQPRQRTGRMTTVPPVRGAGGARAAAPPYRTAARSNRDDLGCVTWLIGSAILLGIVGLVVLAFKLGPGAFSDDAEPTATVADRGERASIRAMAAALRGS
jgi:serine/threonine-protein kinase